MGEGCSLSEAAPNLGKRMETNVQNHSGNDEGILTFSALPNVSEPRKGKSMYYKNYGQLKTRSCKGIFSLFYSRLLEIFFKAVLPKKLKKKNKAVLPNLGCLQ